MEVIKIDEKTILIRNGEYTDLYNPPYDIYITNEGEFSFWQILEYKGEDSFSHPFAIVIDEKDVAFPAFATLVSKLDDGYLFSYSTRVNNLPGCCYMTLGMWGDKKRISLGCSMCDHEVFHKEENKEAFAEFFKSLRQISRPLATDDEVMNVSNIVLLDNLDRVIAASPIDKREDMISNFTKSVMLGKYKPEMKYLYYGDVLTDTECVSLGETILEFKDGVISYSELREKIRKWGFEFHPMLRNILFKQIEAFEERVANDDLKPSDIEAYILSTPSQRNILVKCDRNMFEKLAETGNERAITELNFWQGRKLGKRN